MTACSSIRTNTEFYEPILEELKEGEFKKAAEELDNAVLEEEYDYKDRLLMYLDEGIINYYAGNYEESNSDFERAELAIEELYTKSISKAGLSILLNDNALEYRGEVYEDLYINIFKALNFINLNRFEEAYVEVNRINNKLKELNIYYEQLTGELNESEDSKFDIDPSDLDYYNNVLANYIAHLIFRAEGEFDNSRISLEKLNRAWDTYSDVYNYEKPSAVKNTTSARGVFLNVIAFAGPAPIKVPVGARITTFNDFILVSDPSNYYNQPIIIPGIEFGYNFKFEFPEIFEEGTEVYSIELWVDGENKGELELLENMCNVAVKTFESNKSLIYFKTIMRALAKGIGSAALGDEMKEGIEEKFLADLAVFITNAVVDMTENADLRSWRTMPGYSFVKEIELEPGSYNVAIKFLDEKGMLLSSREYRNFKVTRGLNLVDAFHLN
jgi:hypothetical protein